MLKSYLVGSVIREIRKRKGLRQATIQNLDFDNHDSQTTLSRIENLKQDPTQNTISELLSRIGLPHEEFFCPFLETQDADTFALNHQISFLLDRAEGNESIQSLAQDLIEKLKSKLDMQSIINKQLWISLKTRLNAIAGNNIEETLELVKEGILLTYPEFDEKTFDGDMLIFCEGELLLTSAICYSKLGNTSNAIEILSRTIVGWSKLPFNEFRKDTLLCQLRNTLTQMYLDIGDYDTALTSSDEGLAIAKREARKAFMPNAVYLRGLAIFYANGGIGKKVKHI